jgi:hypothetical protein
MINTLLRLMIVCLTLCTVVHSARAELKFQSKMDAACWPAAAVSYTPLRWQGREACTDCFAWRVACASGRSYELHSDVHPGTTALQYALYQWGPWSALVYLLPFLLYVGIATVGSQTSPALLALNVLFLGYAAGAAWALYASVAGNPWGSWSELQRAFFLNPWAYGGIVGLFALLNLPAVLRGLETFFYRHPPAAPVVPLYPLHAASMSAGLMPQLYEFTNPTDSAAHYRRETDRMRALREKFEAQTALADAVIRHQRTRNRAKQDN